MGLVAAVALLVLVAATPPAQETRPQAVRAQEELRFVDRAVASGLTFRHETGAGGKRYMVETMGSGLAAVDLDVDGWLDVYFAQGAATPGADVPAGLANALYRGNSQGTFEKVDGAADSRAWSMGVAVADYDNDGYPDIYVSNLGANELYRNNGDGTWSELGAAAGVDNADWGASAAWSDIDLDGDLDLYVTNYVDFTWDNHKFCGNPRRNLRAYCHPDVYNAVADKLYRNDGDGTFTEIGAMAGIADTLDGKGLGVVFGDFDNDGDPDAYVANDSTRNFLYRNDGAGRFEEDGLLAGVGFSADGQAEAGMGTDWGDFDGDGLLDVFVTNLDLETNSLYRNLGDGSFAEVTFARGLGEPSLLRVGFGTNWADFDNDGDLDLFVANGHIIDNIADFRENIAYAQPNQVYRNDGAHFVDVGQQAGLTSPTVSRGSVIADFDRDGRVDIVVSNNGGIAQLHSNQSTAGNWIALHLVGRHVNRWATGVRVVAVTSSGASLLREVRTGSSFCSSGPTVVHLGLGSSASASIEVRWPGGAVESLGEVIAGRQLLVREGSGVVAAR